MKMMLSVKWMVRCTLLLACSTLAAPRLGLPSSELEYEDNSNNLLPGYLADNEIFSWNDASDNMPSIYSSFRYPKVEGSLSKRIPQLSINNPLETLREKLRFEIAREQMEKAKQERDRQVERNRALLGKIG